MMNRIAVLFLIIGFFLGSLLFPAVAQAESARAKLSPHLQMLISTNPNLVEIAKRRVHLKTAPESAEPMVDTLVLFQGNPKAVEAYGARVRSVLGNVATVDIPLRALAMVANHSNVVRIEEARKLKPRLDVSVPASGANGVWGTMTDPPGSSGANLRSLPPPWTGNTGQNVVVGLVDTGIDLSHLDFKDSFGKSRVLYVLDQNTGKECTKQQIDAGTCTEKDTDGHGTHVMGIAAGNGSATGNSKPAYRYIGMAPEADLIVVNSTFIDTDIVDGIAYIQDKAAALPSPLPSVINLSLGGHFGPHDGTSLFEMAMDSASGVGKVIVAAAGNEGQTGTPQNFPIHASDLGTDKVVDVMVGPTVGFSVPSGSTYVLLDLWYSGVDQIGVKVTSPSCGSIPSSGFIYPGTTASPSTSCGSVTIMPMLTNPANGDHEITIELQSVNSSSFVKTGTWTFTLTGSGCGSSPCVTNGAFDVWIDDVSSNATFADHIDFSKTVGMPATATEAIAVGAYTTKTSWTSSNGPASDTYGTVGDITFFSSLGPRRACSLIANCPATHKPELAAPGEEIMSSHAAGTSTTGVCFAASNQCLDPDGQHIVFQGTSMSTPHVTGASALLLAQNATLTSDQVKTALELTRTDSSTGSTPNNTWGYGKLAVDLAIAGAGSSPPPSPAPAAPAGVAAAAGADSATISWTGITNHIFLDGYNVYQSTASVGPYTKSNSNIVSTNSFTVTGLTAGTPYFFVVTSEDTPDIESGFSSPVVTATPTTPSSGGGGCGMINLRRGGPSNPSEAISYFLTLFLPLILIRIFRRLRGGAGIGPISPVVFDRHP